MWELVSDLYRDPFVKSDTNELMDSLRPIGILSIYS